MKYMQRIHDVWSVSLHHTPHMENQVYKISYSSGSHKVSVQCGDVLQCKHVHQLEYA